MSLSSGLVSRVIFIVLAVFTIHVDPVLHWDSYRMFVRFCKNMNCMKLLLITFCHLNAIPSKSEWKSKVKNAILKNKTHLWDQRMAADSDFTFFGLLQPAVERAVVFKMCNRSLYRNTIQEPCS